MDYRIGTDLSEHWADTFLKNLDNEGSRSLSNEKPIINGKTGKLELAYKRQDGGDYRLF
ncbi:MAG: hypothetical protein QM734_06140 [Cyclobacteriaceae bacterium]